MKKLADVRNPEGRLDVFLYRFVDRLMEQAEKQNGITGMREHLLPIVEEAITSNVSRRNVIPREIGAAFRFYQANRRQRL